MCMNTMFEDFVPIEFGLNVMANRCDPPDAGIPALRGVTVNCESDVEIFEIVSGALPVLVTRTLLSIRAALTTTLPIASWRDDMLNAARPPRPETGTAVGDPVPL